MKIGNFKIYNTHWINKQLQQRKYRLNDNNDKRSQKQNITVSIIATAGLSLVC